MVSLTERSVIRLRTFGPLDLDGQGGQELHGALAQPRRAALLAYLALATTIGAELKKYADTPELPGLQL